MVWDDSELGEAQRDDHNLWLNNYHEAEKMVAVLRADELQGKPALAILYDALAHSYYCKTTSPWSVGDQLSGGWRPGIIFAKRVPDQRPERGADCRSGARSDPLDKDGGGPPSLSCKTRSTQKRPWCRHTSSATEAINEPRSGTRR